MRTVSQELLRLLVNASWQILILASLASVCSWVLKNASARQRHFVWVAALLFSVSLPWFAGTEILSRRALSPAPSDAALALSLPREPSYDSPERLVAPASTSETSETSESGLSFSQRVGSIVLVLYSLFLLYRFWRFIKAWQRTRVIRRTSSVPDLTAEAEQILNHCRSVIGTASGEIRTSTQVSVPSTIGIHKPLVILPEKLLREANREILTSAIGHELVHVQRRDYLLNLLYELIYLPISFHPAAALMRRRINQSRELSCDEMVTSKLLAAEVYARSLVQLAGSAVPFSRHATLTVGITDADILEVRIMTILSKSKLSAGKARLLLIAASLLLALPCVAAAAFGVGFNVTMKAPTPQKTIWTKPRAKVNHWVQPEYTQDARENKIEGTVGLAAAIDPKGVVESVEVTKPLYPSLDRSAVEAVKKWRFEPLIADGQPASQKLSVELLFSLAQDAQRRRVDEKVNVSEQEKEDKAKRRDEERRAVEFAEMKARAERDPQFKAEFEEKLKREPQLQAELDERERRMQEERKAMTLSQSTLAKTAKITMEQAIQIANGQNPGKVMSCNLVGQGWESLGKLSKDGRVLYHVVIISPDETSPTFTHVWVNAVDGTIHKTETERRRQEMMRTPISGGILNGKAVSLPNPSYPEIARAAQVSGSVQVQVTIDEEGNVVEARAVSGHPLLQAASVEAARMAKFSPTRLSGEPVRVNGVVVYNFVAQ